jgi:hypothetical protein
MPIGQNGKLKNKNVDNLASWRNGTLVKLKVGELQIQRLASW